MITYSGPCRLLFGLLLSLTALPASPWSQARAAMPAALREQTIAGMRPASASDPRFGVVQAFADPLAASKIGVRWERITFWWSQMQPRGPRSWNAFATGHDRAINAELRAGRRIAGLLINTPDWAAVDPALHGISVPKGLYRPYNDPRNYWGRFVWQMARRYAGRINDWIIWNEISIPRGKWHTWAGSIADYVQLVKVADLAAKAANPHARIILAGDPYWYDLGAGFRQVIGGLSRAPGAAKHQGYFDAANLHLYSRPTELAPIVDRYRSILAQYGFHKPIWLSETNAIPYNDPMRRYPRAGFFASLDDQASFIVDVYAIGLAIGLQRIEVNRMADGTDFTAGGEPFGLVRNNGTPRPALFAYRTVSALFARVTSGTLRSNPRTGLYRVTLRRPDEQITVLWDQQPQPLQTALLAYHATATLYDKWGDPTRLQARHGYYWLTLRGATDNTDPVNPHDYVIGGSPLIVVQTQP